MKKFLVIIFISICFLNPSQADDIRDLQIEGISVGDNTLDHFSKSEINSKKFFFTMQKDNREYASMKVHDNLNTFGSLTLNFKTESYDIDAISAFINIKSIEECQKKRRIIVNDIKSLFLNTEKQDYEDTHFLDKETKISTTLWNLKNGFVRVACYNWSDKSGYPLELRVETANNKYVNFLNSLK